MFATRRVSALILTLGVGMVATACGGNREPAEAPGTASPTGQPSPTSSPTESPTVTAEPSEIPDAELEDGTHFVFVRNVDPAARAVTFDLAYFLTGDEANEAAAEHGDETPVPNDYYIVNDNPRLRTLALAPTLEIVLIDWNHCCDRTFDGDLGVFATAVGEETDVIVGDLVYRGHSPFWLTVQDGRVVLIEEQYLP